MSRKTAPLTVTMEERKAVESLANSRAAPYRQVQRACLVSMAVEGIANTAIAQEVELSRAMVVQWRQRFIGLAGLADRPRPRVNPGSILMPTV